MAAETALSELPVSRLRQDWAEEHEIFAAQPQMTRIFLEQQAREVAEALLRGSRQIRFTLPDRIYPPGASEALAIPPASRRYTMGGWLWRRPAEQVRKALIDLFDQLENSQDTALSWAGASMRYAVASTMVHQMLPDGRPVRYQAEPGDEIPSLPLDNGPAFKSALMATTDATGESDDRGGRQVPVPFAPHARRFFLPQWVALDEADRLLLNRAAEAESYVASMQRYVGTLHLAVSIAPYMVADEAYQRKRAGMLGQLVNQGRALARFYTRRIIETIERRAREGALDRGLALSLPYFDDKQLEMRIYTMTIIPRGRIMFTPAFVVRAVRLEAAKVAPDTSLSASTRKHLLAQFAILEEAFLNTSIK
jgi:hypothetical protein